MRFLVSFGIGQIGGQIHPLVDILFLLWTELWTNHWRILNSQKTRFSTSLETKRHQQRETSPKALRRVEWPDESRNCLASRQRDGRGPRRPPLCNGAVDEPRMARPSCIKMLLVIHDTISIHRHVKGRFVVSAKEYIHLWTVICAFSANGRKRL